MELSREKLRAARKAKGLSQPQLASRVGIHVGTLRAFEQERTASMAAEHVALIARVLDVPMEALFEGADEAAVA